MIEFIGLGTADMAELHAMMEIAHTLYHTPSVKIPRTLKTLCLASIAGAISIDQVLLSGGYGGYRLRSVSAATNFLWSLSKSRGVLERKTDGRVSDVGLFSITEDGLESMEKGIMQLIEKGVLEDTDGHVMDSVKGFCRACSKRKWKQPKNLSHSNGINDLLAAFLPICRMPMQYLRELNVYQTGDTPKAEHYIRYHGSSSFRMDAFLYIKGGAAAGGMDEAIFYEQDTGTQSGMAISGKYANYIQMASEHYTGQQGAPPFRPSLVFGLQCSYDTTKRSSAPAIADGRDTRMQNARNNILSHFAFWSDLTGNDSLKQLTEQLEAAYASTKNILYRKGLEFLADFRSENPEIKKISDVRAYFGGCTDTAKGTATCNTIENMEAFMRRRNIFMERLGLIRAEHLFKLGFRVCTVPNSSMDYYMQYLFPFHTLLFPLLPALLRACGMSAPCIHLPDRPIGMPGVQMPNATYITTSGGRKRIVAFESLSHDMSSLTRIHAMCSHEGGLLLGGIPVTLIVFFSDMDLGKVRALATEKPCSSYCPAAPNSAFMPDSSLGAPRGEILYVCMDSAFPLFDGDAGSRPPLTLGLTFAPDGCGYYRQVLNGATFLPVRNTLPKAATSCTQLVAYRP